MERNRKGSPYSSDYSVHHCSPSKWFLSSVSRRSTMPKARPLASQYPVLKVRAAGRFGAARQGDILPYPGRRGGVFPVLHVSSTYGGRGEARARRGGLPLQVYHQVSRELWSAPGCRHGTAHDRTRDDGRASGTGPTKHMGMDICQEKSRDSPSEGRRSVYRAITWSDRTNGPYRQSRRQGERIIVEELPHTARRPVINPLLRY